MARQISRLPPLPEPLPAAVEELFAERLKRSGRVLNVHHTFAHAPKLSRASMQMAMGLRYETSVPRLFIEIAIVRAAQLARGTYELQQHKPMLLAEGFSSAKLDALADWRKSPLFDDKERALLAYVDEMADHGNVTDATFKRLGEFFDPTQVVELSFAAGIYYGTALIMNALRIELEPQ
jgi:4-carboxymuconolactone decarboxylase